MVSIPDSLRCVFSTTVREHGETYVVEIPTEAIDHDAVDSGETYRVALLDAPTTKRRKQKPRNPDHDERNHKQRPTGPPVEEGEVRTVTIEAVGDQGDGIAKVEHGYVVIVPDAEPGEQPTVKIKQVRQNVAFASVLDPQAL